NAPARGGPAARGGRARGARGGPGRGGGGGPGGGFGRGRGLAPPGWALPGANPREARAQGKYKKQTGGRGQYGDAHIVIEPIESREGYEFVDKIVGGVIPQGFRPAVDKGIQEAMLHGDLAGAPVQGVRVQLVDGSYHTVDS